MSLDINVTYDRNPPGWGKRAPKRWRASANGWSCTGYTSTMAIESLISELVQRGRV